MSPKLKQKQNKKMNSVRNFPYPLVYSENSAWCNWWMSYLNFQIEHHLFPSMPQFRHPIVSPRVKALFEKHGLKYDQRPYFTAMSDTFKNLHNVGYDVFFG